MKKKKGFTLIELLAVIIILAVIALIAVPLVMSTINDAKKGAAINSGYGLITAIEHGLAVEMIQDTGANYASGSVTLSNGVYYFDGTKALSVSYKGNPATSVSLQVENGVVVSGMITIDGFDLTVGQNGSIQPNEVPLVTTPVKGDIISLNLGTTYGEKNFRILSINGNNAKVIQLSDTDSIQGSNVDTFLDETYYGNLSSEIKSAIIPQTIDYKTYSMTILTNEGPIPSTSVLSGTYNSGNTTVTHYFSYVGTSSSATKNVFLLDIQDVADYLGKDNLSTATLNEMFMPSAYHWAFRSRKEDGTNRYSLYGDSVSSGTIMNYVPDQASYPVRPSFVIDLSQVDYEIVRD